MSRVLAPLLLLLVAVLHTPTQAQALVFSLFPDIFPFGTNEPVMLLITGAALLSLAHVGSRRQR